MLSLLLFFPDDNFLLVSNLFLGGVVIVDCLELGIDGLPFRSNRSCEVSKTDLPVANAVLSPLGTTSFGCQHFDDALLDFFRGRVAGLSGNDSFALIFCVCHMAKQVNNSNNNGDTKR